MKIEDLYLSIEKQPIDEYDATKENTDVVILLDSGEKYIASFFTYDNINKLKEKHRKSGEYLSGKYFRVDHMVLVESCSREYVREIVEYMIDEGDFESVFRKI